jgi:hypothetical protein
MSASQKLTLGAMTVALTLLALYAASILPAGRLVCYFLSSLFIYSLVCENAYVTAFTAFLACAALAFLIIPDRNSFFVYVVLPGHFGIFKTLADRKIRDGVLRFFSKLLYCNVFICAGIYIALAVMGPELKNSLPKIPMWLLVVIAEAAFILYDFVYSVSQRIYEARIRGFILSGR